MKRRTGRRGAPGVSTVELADLATRSGYELIPLRPEHAITLDDLGVWHGDPLNRLLVAQAIAERTRLLTHDEALGRYGDSVLVF